MMMSGAQKNWIMSGITLISPRLQSALELRSILEIIIQDSSLFTRKINSKTEPNVYNIYV